MDPQTTIDLKQVFLTSLAFMSILLLIVLVTLIRRFRQRLQQYQLQLAREVELIDAERRRIHTDLHDELGTGLAGISLLAQQVQTHNAARIANKIYRQTHALQTKIKEIAYNFVPVILETRGLSIAIQDYVQEIASDHPVTITADIHIADQLYALPKSVHLYRLLRELLTNALKHARCNRICLRLSEDARSANLFLSDNGIGFLPEQPATWLKGTGLSHIRSRANILKARMSIRSAPGAGTEVSMIIPLQSLRS
ncbi:MAG: hypothetical protein IM584_06300 [Chitinophagaceae bacterium]|nr:hypothetical protein [Chitinophagaceae bacterium]MCA6452843.1 hypothetical protein [Chitinophagaceae bacterium]MCA6455730.1 hypothetical protein [Chitinophagaceae bacterium]MCA6460466.1 hypothetical protein [Chitinophagaceae bacterium]MCA6465353.1 hypothetical protein [Chitinophagaceae bacterium]